MKEYFATWSTFKFHIGIYEQQEEKQKTPWLLRKIFDIQPYNNIYKACIIYIEHNISNTMRDGVALRAVGYVAAQ